MRRFSRAAAMICINAVISSVGAGQWIPVKSSGTDAGLRGVHNAGQGIIWASGTKGTVLRSEDDGFSWQKCSVPTDAEPLDFRGVWAWTADHATVMSIGTGDASRLYETTDGCASWRLVFKNPDATGFWDGIAFSGNNGMLVGDPVDGRFSVFITKDKGLHWSRDTSPQLKAEAAKNGIFAASNTSLTVRSPGAAFAFATGGLAGPRFLMLNQLLFVSGRNSHESSQWFSTPLPLASGLESSGAFSLAFRTPDVGLAVGGDYKQPAKQEGTAAYTVDSGVHWVASAKAPSGFRSAVAWSSKLQCWIAVGPNGSDVSVDDGKTWMSFGSGNWNALSLPWVVGPKGQIARLDEQALRSLLTKK